MEPTLHIKQGLSLLERVLQFYPIMREGNSATVTLTEQDWLVLMDFSENPEAKPLIPSHVTDISVDRGTRTIHLRTGGCDVAVKMGF